jgi:hypothetical protein
VRTGACEHNPAFQLRRYKIVEDELWVDLL